MKIAIGIILLFIFFICTVTSLYYFLDGTESWWKSCLFVLKLCGMILPIIGIFMAIVYGIAYFFFI